jgi:phospholipid transport system substrate-binding protein
MKQMKRFSDMPVFPGCISSLLIVVFVFLCPVDGKAEQSGPAEVIKKFNAALLDSMKSGKELGYSGRYKLLEPVVKDSFALSYMTGVSVGQYWNRLSEKERRLFLETYVEWTIATYAGRFDEYSGEKFEVVSESKLNQDNVTVVSRLRSAKKETDFYYRLRKMEGKWRIVDIQISGVSQLALTRSQFVSVLRDKGFSALISMLKKKIANFSSGKSA